MLVPFALSLLLATTPLGSSIRTPFETNELDRHLERSEVRLLLGEVVHLSRVKAAEKSGVLTYSLDPSSGLHARNWLRIVVTTTLPDHKVLTNVGQARVTVNSGWCSIKRRRDKTAGH